MLELIRAWFLLYIVISTLLTFSVMMLNGRSWQHMSVGKKIIFFLMAPYLFLKKKINKKKEKK